MLECHRRQASCPGQAGDHVQCPLHQQAGLVGLDLLTIQKLVIVVVVVVESTAETIEDQRDGILLGQCWFRRVEDEVEDHQCSNVNVV